MFSEGFLKGKLSLEKTINLLSTNIASYFNISNKGKLIPGYDADLSFIDLWDNRKIEARSMYSKGKYTPFEGLRLDAVINQTFLRGKKVFDSKETFHGSLSYGKFVKIG